MKVYTPVTINWETRGRREFCIFSFFFEDSHALSHRFPEFYRPIGLDILGEAFYYPGQLFHYSALVYHLWRLRNHRCPITVHQFLILAIYIFSLVFDSNHLKIFVPSVWCLSDTSSTSREDLVLLYNGNYWTWSYFSSSAVLSLFSRGFHTKYRVSSVIIYILFRGWSD